MNRKMTKLALAVAAIAFAGGAWATDSGSGTMGVTASIAEECSVGNTTALTFGQLSMFSSGSVSTAASDSTGGGTFDAICTSGTTTPKLKFTSANAGGTSTFRMVGTDTTTFIAYTLAESGGTAIAYDTAAAFTNFSADGTTKSLSIIGSVADTEKSGKAKQAYGDTITITTTYGI